MEKILYAKYNRTRVPKYQTVTKICEQDGKRHVIKEALLKEACEHVESMEKKYNVLIDKYVNVIPCKCYMKNGKAFFDYSEGRCVADIIKSDMMSLDETLRVIEKYVNLLFVYNDNFLSGFSTSEEFEKIFGEISEIEGLNAVNGADIDLIFDNVFFDNNQYICIDYEWTIECLVPVDFIKYRALYYFYAKNYAFFQNKINVCDFLEYYGIQNEMQKIYKCMDDSFQQQVHGNDWVNIYTRNYEKKYHSIKDLINRHSDLEGTIASLCDELKVEKESLEHMRYEYQVLMDAKASIIREKDYEISHLKKTDADYKEQLSNLINNKKQLEKELESYNVLLQNIKNSVSWKLTKPIRLIFDFIRGKR